MTPLRISTVIRWADDSTTPVMIEPCRDGSDDWRIVDDDETIAQWRRQHCVYVAKWRQARRLAEERKEK